MNKQYHRPFGDLRPNVSFAYGANKYSQGMTGALLDRLRAIANILDTSPMETFDDVRAPPILAQTEILITGWGAPVVDPSVLDRSPRLKLIAHLGATVKAVLPDSHWQSTVRVTAAVEAVALPVVEYTMAMIVLSAKNILARADDYRQRQIHGNFGDNPLDTGLLGTTVGVVGASRVGLQVIERLRAFDVEVLVYDPYFSREHALSLGAEKVELDELMDRSRIVTLHAPVLPETRHMVNAERLAMMPDGGTIINTGRGHLLDHEALLKELTSRRIFAVLDVTEPEPLPADSALWLAPNLLLTPHVAGPMGSERQRIVAAAIADIERFVDGRSMLGEVLRSSMARIG